MIFVMKVIEKKVRKYLKIMVTYIIKIYDSALKTGLIRLTTPLLDLGG